MQFANLRHRGVLPAGDVIYYLNMGVGTGPAGPAAAGPIFSKKKKNFFFSLANMGVGTSDDDPFFRLTCCDNV